MWHFCFCWSLLCATMMNIIFLLQCVWLVWSVVSSQYADVPLQEHSSMFSNVNEIRHFTNNRTFTIALKPTRRCLSPTFLVRLSGAAMYKVEQISLENDILSFQYQPLVDPGEYFLDVIALLCERFNPMNLTEVCLVSPHKHGNVINAPYSFKVSADETMGLKRSARWKNTGVAVFVPTRYQSLAADTACDQHYEDIYCTWSEADIQPYHTYQWVDGPIWVPTVKDMHGRLSKPPAHKRGQHAVVSSSLRFNVCLMGDSHARELTFNGWDHFDALGYITFTFVVSLFPAVFDPAYITQYECSVVIVSYGQWPLSQYAPAPFREDDYRAQMTIALTRITEYDGPVKVFFRSENYNGLSGHNTACPHSDSRLTPAFDCVNAVAQEVCAKFRVPFIDLHPVIGPMWDAALDFSHPNAPVLRAELDTILYAVFSRMHNSTVPMFPYEAITRMMEIKGKVSFQDQSRWQMHKMYAYYALHSYT